MHDMLDGLRQGLVRSGASETMTDWASTPQSVKESQWRFPQLSELPEDDLVGVGADLLPSTIIQAYRQGIFPMASGRGGALGWWSPDPRGIVPLDRLRVTRSMRQSAKRCEIRVDSCFAQVIRACASPSRRGAWISEEFVFPRRRAARRIRTRPTADPRRADLKPDHSVVVEVLTRPCLRPSSMWWCTPTASAGLRQGLVRKVEPREQAGVESLRLRTRPSWGRWPHGPRSPGAPSAWYAKTSRKSSRIT